jgi:hypothetical protein
MPKEVAEKVLEDRKFDSLGLKPGLTSRSLRGAYAPLFHVIGRFREFSATSEISPHPKYLPK